MQQIADVQNSALWEQVFSVQQSAQLNHGTFTPIPEIIIPTTISSPLVICWAGSSNAPFTWHSAGYISKYISSGVFVGGNQNTKVDFSRRILLNQPMMVEFAWFGESYGLIFRPHKWLQNIEFQVWMFTGQLTSDTDEQLEAARVDILRIEEEVKLITRQTYTVTIQ
jgi:hypothetical protein